MGKKLKVAFAMGGGASLGAFSGGAMAEVLRQLHTNLDRSTYDAVEIDVLSGASAGGMTLGLLVRGLADARNDSDAAAVERVRTLMRRAWVEEIDIDRLVPRPDMSEPASLFDRGAVDAIARDLLSLSEIVFSEEPSSYWSLARRLEDGTLRGSRRRLPGLRPDDRLRGAGIRANPISSLTDAQALPRIPLRG